jgi:hypothetical protein
MKDSNQVQRQNRRLYLIETERLMWWRRRESNSKLAIFRRFFNYLTVRELWSQPVAVPTVRSIS